jgi:hypothetical protein
MLTRTLRLVAEPSSRSTRLTQAQEDIEDDENENDEDEVQFVLDDGVSTPPISQASSAGSSPSSCIVPSTPYDSPSASHFFRTSMISF